MLLFKAKTIRIRKLYITEICEDMNFLQNDHTYLNAHQLYACNHYVCKCGTF